jgi:general stress protein 26
VAGRAEVLFDRDKAEELWHPMLRSYFPDGLEDPHLALLKVEVHSAQYWETPEGPVRRIMGAAKAMFTGEQHIPGSAKRIELGRTG